MSENQTESYLQTLLEKYNALPAHRFLGVELRHYGQGAASAAMPISEVVMGLDGGVGEGPLSTLANVASHFAVMTLLAQGRSVITLEQRIHLLAPTKSGRLIAKANVDRLLSRVAQCSFIIIDNDGELVANGGMMAYVLPREQVGSWSQEAGVSKRWDNARPIANELELPVDEAKRSAPEAEVVSPKQPPAETPPEAPKESPDLKDTVSELERYGEDDENEKTAGY